MERDGYYIVTTVCMVFGILFLIGFIIPSARKLQGQCGSTFIVMAANFLQYLPSVANLSMAFKAIVTKYDRYIECTTAST